MEVLAASRNVSWGACHWLPRVEAPNGKCPRTTTREFFHHPDWHFSSWHVPIQYYNTRPDLFQWFQNASLFAIVRNPYDRIVSEWNYASHGRPRDNVTAMNEYLSTALDAKLLALDKWWAKGDHWIRQVEFVSNISNQHVYILHYEDLAHEFSCLEHTFGMNWTWPANHLNAAHGHLTAANLTKQTRALIAKYYAPDFEKFGYAV